MSHPTTVVSSGRDMSLIEALPAEMLQSILGEIKDHKDSRATLHNCALTCRSLYIRVRPLLFKELVFKFDSHYVARAEKLQNVLASRPAIIEEIRILCVTIEHIGQQSVDVYRVSEFVNNLFPTLQFLGKCHPNTLTFDVMSSSTGKSSMIGRTKAGAKLLQTNAKKLVPIIQYLHFGFPRAVNPSAEDIAFFSRFLEDIKLTLPTRLLFPSFKRQSNEVKDTAPIQRWLAPLQCTSLEHLDVEFSNLVHELCLIWQLMLSSAGSLKTCHWTQFQYSEHLKIFDFNSLSSLEQLSIRFAHPMPGARIIQGFVWISQMLNIKSTSNLEVISIKLHLQSSFTTDKGTSSDLVLAISEFNRNLSSARGSFPHLRHLGITIWVSYPTTLHDLDLGYPLQRQQLPEGSCQLYAALVDLEQNFQTYFPYPVGTGSCVVAFKLMNGEDWLELQ